MIKLVFVLAFFSIVTARLTVAELNVTIPSAHVTSQGYGWGEFDTVTAPLRIVTADLDCEQVRDQIVLIRAANHIDNKIYDLLLCGARGVALVGFAGSVPGSVISNFLNERLFSNEFPNAAVVDLVSRDGEMLLKNATDGMTVTIEWQENRWKNMSNSGGYYFSQIFNGLFSFLMTIVFLYLIICLSMANTQANRVWIIISSLGFTACVIRTIGFVDFRSWRQVWDYKASLMFSNMGTPFIFSMCWFLALVMLTVLMRNRINNIIIMKPHLAIYFVITGIFVASHFANTFVLTLSSANSYIMIVSIIWVLITFGLILSIAIIFTVAFARLTDAKIKSLKLSDRKSRHISRIFTINFLVSLCLFVCAILVICGFFVSSQPENFLVVLIGLPTVETVILALVIVSAFMNNPSANPSTQSRSTTGHSRTNSGMSSGSKTEIRLSTTISMQPGQIISVKDEPSTGSLVDTPTVIEIEQESAPQENTSSEQESESSSEESSSDDSAAEVV